MQGAGPGTPQGTRPGVPSAAFRIRQAKEDYLFPNA